MRKLAATITAFVLTVVLAGFALAGGVPAVPSNPTWNEPSQLLNTLNTFIRTLNGVPTDMGSVAVPSLGSYCTGSGAASAAVTCNGTRGQVTFTSVGNLAPGAVVTVTVKNSAVNAPSACSGQIISNGGTAGSAPYVSTISIAGQTMSLLLGNGATQGTGTATLVIGFNCFQ